MKQIRISRKEGLAPCQQGQRFICEWMEASLNNRWFLKVRLAQALQVHGPDSHWIEMREESTVRVLALEPAAFAR